MSVRTVVDHALAGDDTPLPIGERRWWREAIEEPDPVQSIQLYARNMCRISGRAGLVLRALETAASIDADAAEVWARFQHQRRVGLHEFAVTLAQKTSPLRYDEKIITDTMWMLAPDAYLRLVHDAGWPVEQFQAWLADLLQRMFLE
jgi:hypothetical protein